MKLGERLKSTRLERQETLHMVAMGTNIDMTLLSKFERGDRHPTNKQLERIAKFFGFDQKELAIEATAGRILTEYGYNDVTSAAALSVQEEITNYLADKEGTRRDE
jgi:transcriptional regulator with XRE-family HTH domain